MKSFWVTFSGPHAPAIKVEAEFFSVDPGSGALVFWRTSAPDAQPRAFQAVAGWCWKTVEEEGGGGVEKLG